jgi:hypothetical protein
LLIVFANETSGTSAGSGSGCPTPAMSDRDRTAHSAITTAFRMITAAIATASSSRRASASSHGRVRHTTKPSSASETGIQR